MQPVLPELREDLELLPGPAGRDGQPTWTIHDPIRNRFFRLDWLSFEVLSRWSLRDPAAIAESIATATMLPATPEDVHAVARFLLENDLALAPGLDHARLFAHRQEQTRGWLRQALHHYLFFRVPLIRPDAWLTRLQPLVAPFFSRAWFALTAVALAGGLYQAWRQADTFRTTLVNTLNLEGALAYAAAIIAIKVLHELGHAFSAKRAGCRVPTMGIAFMVLWPVAYTDTNDAWRLTDRWARLRIAAAGVATELMVGAWALLAWGLLPPGELRSACFVLSTLSLAATLAINASPFMRFDGYFLLCDWLDLPNLHQRSFALARWHLREVLFAFGAPKPEHFPPGRQAALILFAWATWLYRLVVFLGIAVLVYHFFIKAVGILLFAVEIGWFIAWPVGRELQAWRGLWRSQRGPASFRRAGRSAGIAAALIALVFLPWPGRVRASALLEPGRSWNLYTPGPGQLLPVAAAPDAPVQEGDPVMRLRTPEVEARVAGTALASRSARHQADRAALSADQRAHLPVLEQQAASAEGEHRRWRQELERYTARAPFAGRLRPLDPDLTPGDWLAAKHLLGSVVAAGPARVETYLDEEQVKHVTPGCAGLFIIDSAAAPPVRVTVTRVDRDATRALPDGRLTARAGGHIVTRDTREEHLPERAVYRVTLSVDEPLAALGQSNWRGAVVLRTEAFSPATRYLHRALSVLLRETGW